MEVTFVDEAVELLEKANADLEPELLSAADARARLESYARVQRLAALRGSAQDFARGHERASRRQLRAL